MDPRLPTTKSKPQRPIFLLPVVHLLHHRSCKKEQPPTRRRTTELHSNFRVPAANPYFPLRTSGFASASRQLRSGHHHHVHDDEHQKNFGRIPRTPSLFIPAHNPYARTRRRLSSGLKPCTQSIRFKVLRPNIQVSSPAPKLTLGLNPYTQTHRFQVLRPNPTPAPVAGSHQV